MRSSALMASGEVPSWPITKSTSATTMSPACASVPAWAERIFSAIVLPAIAATYFPAPAAFFKLLQVVVVDVQQLLVVERALQLDRHRTDTRQQLGRLLVGERDAVLVELEQDAPCSPSACR